MKYLRFFLTFLICCSSIPATSTSYERNPSFPQDTWESLKPYFLPEDHPIKPNLDKIFSASRVTESSKTVKKAGFKSNKAKGGSLAIVSKHSKLKGYLVKMYTDDFSVTYEWLLWKKRIDGAIAVQKAIDEHGYNSILQVPKKWIYPLPLKPFSSNSSTAKNFILVVEDVNRINKHDNAFWWRSIAITPEILEAVYTVIQQVGLADCVHVDNMPFTKSGKIAFIDTESNNHWPVHFSVLGRFLSPQMREYLQMLTPFVEPPFEEEEQ